MARKRMVTRTIKGEQLTILCVLTDTREAFETTVILTEKFKAESKKLEHIATLINPPGGNVKPVTILKSEPISTRYGMTEEAFIRHAHEILNDGLVGLNESEDE